MGQRFLLLVLVALVAFGTAFPSARAEGPEQIALYESEGLEGWVPAPMNPPAETITPYVDTPQLSAPSADSSVSYSDLAPQPDAENWLAQAEDTAPEEPAAEEESGLTLGNGINVSGWFQQGITFNSAGPDDRQNFGRLFDDRDDGYRFNQFVLTLERPLEPEPGCFGFGWKAQFMYGSDARFIHYLGILDKATNDTVQPDLVELFGNFHLPILTPGGLDLKVGHFVTLQGAETIDPNTNPLYSHTYMFNFGIPFKHTGVLGTLHLNDNLDLMAGLTTGINTGWVDNNDSLAFHGGMTMKLCDEKIVIAPSIHVGPETDSNFYTNGAVDKGDGPVQRITVDDGDLRTIVDIVTTMQLSENLKSITDLNYGHEEGDLGLDGQDPEWYGIAQYLIFTCNEKTDFVARWETWRDDDGFAAAQFAENDDFMDLQRGILTNIDQRTVGGGDTTYHALTLGVNYKPCENIKIRPEIRWDWANVGESGVRPFNDSQDDDMFTVGCDVIYTF
jgi:hypothetical protein